MQKQQNNLKTKNIWEVKSVYKYYTISEEALIIFSGNATAALNWRPLFCKETCTNGN